MDLMDERKSMLGGQDGIFFYRRTVVRALFCKHKLFIAGVRGVVLDFVLIFDFTGSLTELKEGREETSTFISSHSRSGVFILIWTWIG